jgi:heptosyltransferase-3
MNRILVIRGGAIGDFILTLPALKALRNSHPHARIEILGYKHIAALAEGRFYAQAVRSIEHARLSSFFARNSQLPTDLSSYFASFNLVISYLYDPDETFETNLRRCGVTNLVIGPAKISNASHAVRQLARPIEELGLRVEDFAAKIYPSNEDRYVAVEFLRDCAPPIVALHPGSGDKKKNWPLENWIAIGNDLLRSGKFNGSLVIISGEAEEDEAERLQELWKRPRVRFARNLPLPHLEAVLENTIFVGHDSGISHLAAAADANSILLFGPTDPAIWGPLNPNVRILRAPSGRLRDLGRADVKAAIAATLFGAEVQTP